jgi:hypothetical protein
VLTAKCFLSISWSTPQESSKPDLKRFLKVGKSFSVGTHPGIHLANFMEAKGKLHNSLSNIQGLFTLG